MGKPGTIEAQLGDEPPLASNEQSKLPDRREVSARWLSGTFLTGVTSSILMGVALFAALDGRERLATPPEIMARAELEQNDDGEAAKASRVVAPRTAPKARDRRRMEVSTVIRDGDRDLVRTLPFVHVRMALAGGHKTDRDYPRFNPLLVFSQGNPDPEDAAPTGLIYGAKVESDVSLKTGDFPLSTAVYDTAHELSVEEVEQVVHSTGALLTDGAVQVAALHYIDPQRFGDLFPGQSVSAPHSARIVAENISISQRSRSSYTSASYAEAVIPFHSERQIVKAMAEAGYDGPDAEGMANAIAILLKGDTLKEGSVVRLGIEAHGEESEIIRASVYDGTNHLLTIAIDDRDQYVPAEEPGPSPLVAGAFDDRPTPVLATGDLPTVYDGIYRAGFAYGMSQDMIEQLIRLLTAEVDYQSRLNATDQIEVFFSQPDENSRATADSQMLFVRANFSGNERNYYRFRTADGSVDYYDGEGRSARQFLLRNPVPNGKFRSGFGMRRHPVLGYHKMHSGVDWSAPRGTPIIAAGNGIVEKAGWAGGYGRQTIIRHANGYKTSYSHQSSIAKGVRPGARVRQGQIIGRIGSTGLTTGPHLHYELMVNKSKVDPMRVRLPRSKKLDGTELAAFQAERERIDALLLDEAERGYDIASQ